MDILVFGQLTDITGTRNLRLTGIPDTSALVMELNRKFPALKDACYIMAVDKTIITENAVIEENSIIALMPPFSGG